MENAGQFSKHLLNVSSWRCSVLMITVTGRDDLKSACNSGSYCFIM